MNIKNPLECNKFATETAGRQMFQCCLSSLQLLIANAALADVLFSGCEGKSKIAPLLKISWQVHILHPDSCSLFEDEASSSVHLQWKF